METEEQSGVCGSVPEGLPPRTPGQGIGLAEPPGMLTVAGGKQQRRELSQPYGFKWFYPRELPASDSPRLLQRCRLWCPLNLRSPLPRSGLSPAVASQGTRCHGAATGLDLPPRVTPTEPGRLGGVHRGSPAALPPSLGQVQMCTHSCGHSLGTTPSPRHPVLVALYLRCLAGSSAWEEAEPSQSCCAEGWPDPQTSDVAFSAIQTLGIARSRGFGLS